MFFRLFVVDKYFSIIFYAGRLVGGRQYALRTDCPLYGVMVCVVVPEVRRHGADEDVCPAVD